MDCPVCGEKLKEIERYGVSIDICPGCKGCWLDRGELEKIAAMEESEPATAPVNRAVPSREAVDRSRDLRGRDDHDDDHKRDDDDRYDRDSRSGGSGYSKPKKRSSLLGDILGSLGGE
jgi:Zn-finger nucleic acid-binding protein